MGLKFNLAGKRYVQALCKNEQFNRCASAYRVHGHSQSSPTVWFFLIDLGGLTMKKLALAAALVLVAGTASATPFYPDTQTPFTTVNVVFGNSQTVSTAYEYNPVWDELVAASDVTAVFELLGTESLHNVGTVAYELYADTNSGIGSVGIGSGPLFATMLSVGQSFSYALAGGSQYVLKMTLSGDTTSSTKISGVPIPGAAWLFGSGLLGFMLLSNRRKV